MKGLALTQAQRMAAGLVLVGTLGGYGYYAYLFTPMLRQMSQLGQEIQNSQRQLQFIEQIIVQGPQLKRDLTQLEDRVAQLRQTLPSVQEMPAALERLSDLARQTGVKIQTIVPERTDAPSLPAAGAGKPAGKGPELYRGVPIQIDALAGFYQLENFLTQLESNHQPLRLQSLRISENPKELRRHTIKLVVIGYFSTLPPEGGV